MTVDEYENKLEEKYNNGYNDCSEYYDLLP